jgi:hypothetical protein
VYDRNVEVFEITDDELRKHRWVAKPRVRDIFDISEMGLWRWIRDPHLGFPRPWRCRGRVYFDADEIRQFAERQRSRRVGSRELAEFAKSLGHPHHANSIA